MAYKTTNLTIRMEQDMKDKLMVVAKQMNTPASDIVREVLKEWLNKHEQ